MFEKKNGEQEAGGGGCCWVVFSLPFVLISIYIILANAAFLQGAISAKGTIVSCTFDSKGNNSSTTVRFTTQKGQQITFQSLNSSNSCREGEGVVVKYHPNDPQDAQVDDGYFPVPAVCIGIAAFCLVVGLLDLTGKGFLRAGYGIGR